jgi:Flp pilus assembly protein TadD
VRAVICMFLMVMLTGCHFAARGSISSAARSHNERGLSLLAKGQTDDAIREFREALRIQPDYADVYLNLGNALMTVGRTDEALTHFQRALMLQPNHAEAHNALGVVLAENGRIDEAIAHYQTALRIKPDFAEAKKNLQAAMAHRVDKKAH